MQGGRRGPGLGVSDGLWSQVINQAGALFPEPPLTPQRHLRRHCGSRRGGGGVMGQEAGASPGRRANAVLGSPGWAWGLILLLCDAGPPQASSSPICEMGSSYSEDKWRSESHVMFKRVDSGDRLPGALSLQLLCKMLGLGCK